MNLTAEQLSEIQSLYDKAQLLRAHQAAESIAPLRQWRGARERVLAGRLAMNLGAPRLGRVVHMLAYRENPGDPAARYYYARAVLERRGPLPAWEFLQRCGEACDAEANDRGDWLSFFAHVAGMFRDFQTADQWLAKAERAAPDYSWVLMERATLLERQDFYVEALAVVQRALEVRPWFRPAVQQAAHLLQLLDRDDESLQLLRDASHQIQSGPVMMQLAGVETELRLFDEARRSWDRAVELSPLAEKAFREWLAARRSDAAYFCGDTAEAARLAKEAKNAFHDKVAEKLAGADGSGRRVMLPVGFVRQHHMTCAPATLSAISRFWSMDVDHLALAEAICYDGTPAHSERSWAEMNGFVTREFRVDWASASALIDAGIPFTFTTTYTTSSHLQAVIGYDSLRGTLLIRDPYERSSGEFIGEATFERFSSTGPRGMALAPLARASDLAEIALPDQGLYDQLYEVQRALAAHDRPRASRAAEEMNQAAPDHRLSLWARRALAGYDDDIAQVLACIDKLLELYPADPNLRLGRLSCLRSTGRREDRLALLETICNEKGADPIFREHYARELGNDARELPKTQHMLRRALRFRRLEASLYHALANVRWEQRSLSDALQLYRLAACLNEKDEGLARSWFIASRHLKETQGVLDQMHDRFARFGRKSSQPIRTLFWAYEQLSRQNEGFALLDEALSLRPDDGELLAFAATAHARFGRRQRAAEFMARAKGRLRSVSWLRVAAELANLRSDPTEALDLWSQIAAAEPLALDAHRELARLIAASQGQPAALAHLEAVVGRFPHNYAINQLRLEWMRDEAPEVSEPAVARFVEMFPTDAWGRREHVLTLLNIPRHDEAIAEAETALRLAPNSPSSHYCMGEVLARTQRLPEARAAFRQAICLSVDFEHAIYGLINACNSQSEKQEELAFVKGELVRQTIFGDGLLAYRSLARNSLPAAAVLESLQEALSARPDLWHAWSTVVAQLSEMGRRDEAHQLALEATRRFPLLPKVWLDLAAVWRQQADRDGEMSALNAALEINPAWSTAVLKMADLHERSGDMALSAEVLEAQVAREPLDAVVHGRLAQALWKLNRRDEALERAATAVRLDPGEQWIWDALRNWANELKKPGFAIGLARELTTKRRGEARSWLVLASVLPADSQLSERLAALEEASKLNPRSLDALDQRALLLCNAHRYDEALAVCRPAAWGDAPPGLLLGRAAWIEAERGNVAAAIAAMKNVVEKEPRYYWGWCRLADWHRNANAHADYLAVARSIHEHWPSDMVGQGYLAEALYRNADLPAARDVIRQTLLRDPDYTFGANLLFTISLETSDWIEAERASELLSRSSKGPAALTRTIRLQIARRQLEEADGSIARLLRDTSIETWMIEAVRQAFKKIENSTDFERALRTDLRQPAPQPIVGTTLMNLLSGEGRWTGCQWLIDGALADVATRRWWRRRAKATEVASPTDAFREQIAIAYLDALGNKKKWPFLAKFMSRYGHWIGKQMFLWGKVGFALKACAQNREVCKWMRDWRQRKDVAGWMLVNLAQAHRACRQDKLSHAVHLHAATLASDPRPRSIHHLWLAFDAVRSGDRAAAESALQQADMKSVGDLHHVLKAMVDSLLAASDVSLKNRRQRVTRARELLMKGFKRYPAFRQHPEYLRAYHQTLRALAATSFSPSNLAWYVGRRFGKNG